MELLKKTIFALVVAVTMAQSAEAVNLTEVVIDNCRAAVTNIRWVLNHKALCALTLSLCTSAVLAATATLTTGAALGLADSLGKCRRELAVCEEIGGEIGTDMQSQLAIYGCVAIVAAALASAGTVVAMRLRH